MSVVVQSFQPTEPRCASGSPGGRLRIDDHRRHARLALQRDDTEGIAAEEEDRVDVGVRAAGRPESALGATRISERCEDRRREVADLLDRADLTFVRLVCGP
jgi:hypothetical protein